MFDMQGYYGIYDGTLGSAKGDAHYNIDESSIFT